MMLRTTLVAALAGGVATAAVLFATGAAGDHVTTTIVQQAPLSGARASQTAKAAVSDTGESTNDSLSPGAIYRRDAPGVVFIRAEVVNQAPSPFDVFPTETRGESTGSGFVVDKSGYLLTNAHVIDGATSVTVSFSDHQARLARIVGKDEDTDLALLKIDPSGLRLTPLTLGDSSSVQVGDPTIAIGNPFGYERTLTTGVVSALQRRIKAPSGGQIDNVIQTDAAINPGNSGGPLLDATGRVIGINSQIATGGGGNQTGSIGIGFAVPSNTARDVIPQLRRTGRVQRAYMGVTGMDIDASLAPLKLPAAKGVLVQSVDTGGPAQQAGLQGGQQVIVLPNGVGQVRYDGDVITKINSTAVTGMADIQHIVDKSKPGTVVNLTVIRDGTTITIPVTLVDRPPMTPSP